jgi:photosystem II stability/assembly factor-like uncharacterized protein
MVPLTARAEWRSLGPWGGDVDLVTPAPSDFSRVYLSAGRILYRSDDEGVSWTPAPSFRSVRTTAIAVSPLDPDFVVTGSLGGILLSHNGGRSATPSNEGLEGAQVWSLLFVDPHTLLAGTDNPAGLALSRDAGRSWTTIGTGLPAAKVEAIAVDPSDPSALLAATRDTILRSSDDGGSWSPVHQAPPVWWNDYPTRLAWSPSDPSRVYAAVYGGIARSDDGGRTFQDLPFQAEWEPAWIVIDPLDADRVLVQTSRYLNVFSAQYNYLEIRESTDAGLTWTTLYDDPDCWECFSRAGGLALDPVSGMFLMGSDELFADGFRRSEDGGATWTVSQKGLAAIPTTQFDVTLDGTVLARGTRWRGLYTSGPGYSFWSQDHDMVRDIDLGPLIPSRFQVNLTNPTMRTETGQSDGEGVLYSYGAYSPTVAPWWFAPPAVRFFSPATFVSNHGDGDTAYYWGVGGGAHVYRYSWDGTRFAFVEVSQGFVAADAVIHPDDPDVIFAATAGTEPVQLSTDGAQTWTSRSGGLPNATPVRILMSRADPERLVVAFADRSPWVTSTGGLRWEEKPVDLAGQPVLDATWSERTGEIFLAVRNAGIVSTRTGGLLGDSPTSVQRVVYCDGVESLFASTRYTGIHVRGRDRENDAMAEGAPRPGDTALETGGEAGGGTRSSASFRPNPLRSGVGGWIPLALPRETTLEPPAVFDAAGRRVRNLTIQPGASGIRWDGRDEEGRPVASGIYFVRTRGVDPHTVKVSVIR